MDENTVPTIDPTYESPIKRIVDDPIYRVTEAEEGYLIECVRHVGFDIDKEELRKALLYDRGQYEKGYSDGQMAREAEIVRCRDCKFWGASLTEEERNECDVCVDLVCTYWMSDGLTRDDFCSQGERRTDDEESTKRAD